MTLEEKVQAFTTLYIILHSVDKLQSHVIAYTNKMFCCRTESYFIVHVSIYNQNNGIMP